MEDTISVWKNSLKDAQRILNEFIEDESQLKKCEQLTEALVNVYAHGGNVFLCGNGGSHCDAMHFAEEMTGKFRRERRPLGALALGDPSHVTCVGNDYGFEYVFARQLAGLGRKGDLLIGLSTSGNSKNIGLAFDTAKEKGIKTVALLGRDGGWLKDKADLVIIIPGETSDRVQEMHIKLVHTAIEACEKRLFKELW